MLVNERLLWSSIYYVVVQVETLRNEVEKLKRLYEDLEEKAVEEAIKKLTPEMQETVRACIKSGKAKGPNGRRFVFYLLQHTAIRSVTCNFIFFPPIKGIPNSGCMSACS